MKRRRKHKGFCPKCRKPLQATTCSDCGGKCYHRQLLISKRSCTRCKGTGKEYHCSDQLSHNEDELRARKQQGVDEWIRSYGQSAAY
jgi:hypothetical protein